MTFLNLEVLLSSFLFAFFYVMNLCIIMNTHRWCFLFRNQSLYGKENGKVEMDKSYCIHEMVTCKYY